MKVSVVQALDSLTPFSKDVFSKFINELVEDLPKAKELANTIIPEVELTVFNGMTSEQLVEATILVCTQNIQNDIIFDKVAARLLLTSIYRNALKNYPSAENFGDLYASSFVNYLEYGIEKRLLHSKMGEVYSRAEVEELSKVLDPNLDDSFDFIGLDTALKRYMKYDWNQKSIETPQFMWMRIAMWMAIKEKNRVSWARAFYKKLSQLLYIPGGSTNIGAGTTYPTLSNCYLIDTDDDTRAIFDNVKNIALISKATGGIGISVTKLRASGSLVKSNNTFSTGPIPFIKVMDTTLKSMSRAGKKHGAMCVYMENWHYDFAEFIDLKQNAGDDYRRVRTADTAVYISDEFMRRVEADEAWYLFDPAEVSDLPELYGKEFAKKYTEYCKMADEGKITLFKKMPAKEQMKIILNSLLSTSHPWLTWKDTINVRALNNNTGTIHSSNLCTEICLPQDRDNIAVCNLAYINLAKHVEIGAEKSQSKMNWDLLKESVRVSMRHLDNLVDVNELSVAEAKKSDEENRAVGLGMSGLAEVFELFGYAYDSEEAYALTDELTEFISYYSIDTTANLAKEKGNYAHFEGSMWSKGMVPYDTIALLDESRRFDPETNTVETHTGMSKLTEKLESKMDKVSDPELKELYAAFKEMTQFMSNTPEVKAAEVTGALKQDRSQKLDWLSLKDKIKGGVRNATVMAIAPNASTGLVLGTAPGIDVRFSQIFSRATSRGKYLDINKNLVKDLQKLNLWDTLKNRIIENYGDVSQITEIPEELRAVYKTSFQVSPYGVIEVASRMQKWIDQSLSRNMYLETREIDDLVEIYTEAWRRGLKTTYYLHTKPRHTA
ncbi:MAG: ribonucleoside-diphosphate reductase subunit alpha, partial [Candidatus Dojkabacteria bacterium]